MKNPKSLVFVLLFGVMTCFVLSCDNSTSPDENHDFPAPIDSVATNISLYVYSDIYGAFDAPRPSVAADFAPVVRIILDTIEMATEGPITVDIEETDPYTDPPQYFIYAEADGFYTELYYCSKGGEINVDLDAVASLANSITGVIFRAPVDARDMYYANDTIVLTGPNDISLLTMTDDQGRYGVGNLPLGTCVLASSYSFSPEFYIEQINTAATDYLSIIFYEPTLDRAPYIYLYPETQRDITVRLGLLPGGEIVASEPPYNHGWNVNVTPDGRINNSYDYLFYESLQSIPLSYQKGWVIEGAHLEYEFRNLLSELGFVENEIDDFIEYWIPKLGNADWYAVYPQNAESIITLDINPRPDKVLRALLLIRPLKYHIDISAPELKEFVRDGFTVAEWGVIWLEK